MQKTRAELSLILVSFFAAGGAAPCGLVEGATLSQQHAASAHGAQHPRRHCGLADGASLLQQHAAAAPASRLSLRGALSAWKSSTRSNATALMAQFAEFNKEAETHSEEEGIRFYEAAHRLANLSGVSAEEKGLMLMQEARKIFGGDDPGYYEYYKDFKKWTGYSQPVECIAAPEQMALQVVGAIVASTVTATVCPENHGDKPSAACYSEGLESARFVLAAIQYGFGIWSYCQAHFDRWGLCGSAIAETSKAAAGVGGASIAVTYKCPEYTATISKKVRDTQCGVGIAKGLLNLGTAVYKLEEFFRRRSLNTANKEVFKGDNAGEFYVGQPYGAYPFQFAAAVAWLVQTTFLMSGGCGGGKGACSAEISELVAVIFETFTGLIIFDSYCLDRSNRWAVLHGSSEETNFKRMNSVERLKGKLGPDFEIHMVNKNNNSKETRGSSFSDEFTHDDQHTRNLRRPRHDTPVVGRSSSRTSNKKDMRGDEVVTAP